MSNKSEQNGCDEGTAVSRRTALAVAGLGTLGGLAGVTGRANAATGADYGGGDRSDAGTGGGFAVESSHPGVQFEGFAAVDFQPQGIAYARDRLYVARVTDAPGNPSTVYEMTRDGTPTGETFTLPADDAVHASGLEWFDGALWAVDYVANEVFEIDWDGRRVVGRFRYGDGVLSDERVSTGTFVPSREGGAKLLLACWRSADAHLIDHEGALRDGTAAGHVEATLRNGAHTSPQGLAFRDGRLYVNWDVPGTNAVTRAPCPYADEIPDGFRLSDGFDWWMYQNVDETALQDLAYDPDRGHWYTAGEFGRRLFRARERNQTCVAEPWSDWTATRSAGVDVDTDAASGHRTLGLTTSPFPGRVGVRYYDDGGDEKRVYAAVSEDVEDRVTLGVNTTRGNGADSYYRWTREGGWADTGVARPSDGGWVRFGWRAAGDEMRLYVSTDDGGAWTDAGVESGVASRIRYLHLEAYDDSSATVGPWSVEPEARD